MSRVTKFAARDPGPGARMAGFVAHLRDNGLRLGVGEVDLCLHALTHVRAADPDHACRALKAICTGCADEAQRFDDLFDAYWRNGGRARPKAAPMPSSEASPHVHALGVDHTGPQSDTAAGAISTPDDGNGAAEAGGEGKLVATAQANLFKRDLRELVHPSDIAAAEEVARTLGAALRDRRSRRRRAARKGDQLDFRKLMRQSLATGGEPLVLPKRARPDRSVKIAALCDVSGSMTVYARVFVAFLAGLLRADPKGDAYLFHTRLVRITEALRDKDALRALARLSLLADGFAGGSKIGDSLSTYADGYARRFVDGRTVVLIFSDGYDTGPAGHLAASLAKLKKRGCKIIWLNPLKGWTNYAPVAAGMAAALPHLTLFRAANTLGDLAALEPELVRL